MSDEKELDKNNILDSQDGRSIGEEDEMNFEMVPNEQKQSIDLRVNCYSTVTSPKRKKLNQ